MSEKDNPPVDRSVDIRRANCGCCYDRISGLLYSRCFRHPQGHRKSLMAGPIGRPDDPPDLEQKPSDNPTLRKKLFNAAAAVSGYFDAEEMLHKRLPYDEQLTHLARLIARELDVAEAIP